MGRWVPWGGKTFREREHHMQMERQVAHVWKTATVSKPFAWAATWIIKKRQSGIPQ